MVKTVGEGFFLKAMLAGYAADVTPIPVSDMPGYKGIVYGCNYEGVELYLVDRWCKNNSGGSAGTTTIWTGGQPVWVMHYGGIYRAKSVTRFLKKALKHAYSEQQFNGGRGPDVFVSVDEEDKGMVYVNHVRLNTFDEFEGTERIVSFSDENRKGWVVGFHHYWGMNLR